LTGIFPYGEEDNVPAKTLLKKKDKNDINNFGSRKCFGWKIMKNNRF
jgi:hypothetical protein